MYVYCMRDLLRGATRAEVVNKHKGIVPPEVICGRCSIQCVYSIIMTIIIIIVIVLLLLSLLLLLLLL